MIVTKLGLSDEEDAIRLNILTIRLASAKLQSMMSQRLVRNDNAEKIVVDILDSAQDIRELMHGKSASE